MSNSVNETQNSSFSFAYGPRVNLELSGFELTLELATRHNFEAADHLYVAHQLPFDLELAGGDMGIDLCVRAYDQKITGLDLTSEAAIDPYRQIVTELSGYRGIGK